MEKTVNCVAKLRDKKKRKENQRYDDETLIVQPMNDWLMKEKSNLGMEKTVNGVAKLRDKKKEKKTNAMMTKR